jgi:cytochrome c-type biogenesis protein CcmH
MRARALPVGVGLAIGVLAAAAVLAIGDAASRTPAERAEALAAELRCPDCQGLSVADSPTRSAQEMRRQIDELVAGGAGDEDVRAHFTARYGEWIRLAPSAPAVWLIPFVAVAVGVAVLFAWLARRRPRASEPAVSAPPTDEERRRLHDEVEALDA